MAQSLTDQQKRRIEENRKRALELRAKKNQSQQGSVPQAQFNSGRIVPSNTLFTKLDPVYTTSRNSNNSQSDDISQKQQSLTYSSSSKSGNANSNLTEPQKSSTTKYPSFGNKQPSISSGQSSISHFNPQFSSTGLNNNPKSISPLKKSQFGAKTFTQKSNSQSSDSDNSQGSSTKSFQNMKCSTSSFYSKKTSKMVSPEPRPTQSRLEHFATSPLPAKHFVTHFVSPDKQKPQTMFQKPMFPSVKNTCTFVLESKNTFSVEMGFDMAVINVFKTMKTKHYDATLRKWSFNIQEHRTLVKALQESIQGIDLHPLPRHVLTTFLNPNLGTKPPEANLTNVDAKLVEALMPFQKEGVNFAIHHNGRALIADDMGLGKTLQAMCVACYYRTEWPLLIVAPSSVKYAWAKAFEQWVPSLDKSKIHVILSGEKKLPNCKVNIISYDLMGRRTEQLKKKNYQVIIMDESHFLKNYKTVRTKAALPLLKNAPRRILLSGTPALSRPAELYTQVQIIDSTALPSFHEFGLRYCAARQSNWGWDYSGSSNLKELQMILEERVMIRRLKSDVMSQLPAKIRQVVILDPKSINTSSRTLKAVEDKVTKEAMKGKPEQTSILQYFTETALVKLKAVSEYLHDLLEGDQKCIIFAYHQSMLDTIQAACDKKKVKFIRIDGKTPANQRQEMCDNFQKKAKFRVAILSIVAANAGITLTAATLVVFAELFWNPGILVQAEDRAHRIGQEDNVFIRYLIAKGTVDDLIWPLIQKKLKILNQAGLSKNASFDVDMSEFKNRKQESILPFLEKTILEEEEKETATQKGDEGGPVKDEEQQNHKEKETEDKQTDDTNVCDGLDKENKSDNVDLDVTTIAETQVCFDDRNDCDPPRKRARLIEDDDDDD